jgi:hypothetical protein
MRYKHFLFSDKTSLIRHNFTAVSFPLKDGIAVLSESEISESYVYVPSLDIWIYKMSNKLRIAQDLYCFAYVPETSRFFNYDVLSVGFNGPLSLLQLNKQFSHQADNFLYDARKRVTALFNNVKNQVNKQNEI